MSELAFTLVDVIMFVLSGMALGFVIGAAIMKKTFAPPPMEPWEVIMKRFSEMSPRPEDEAESFHEECGDR